MTVAELVAFFAGSLRLVPPHPQFDDDVQLSAAKIAFPRPDLLAWFDGQGGAALAPRAYGVGLLYRTAIEWRRLPHLNRIVTGGPGNLLEALDPVRRPATAILEHWCFEAGEMPSSAATGDAALVFGWVEDENDLGGLIRLLLLHAPWALRVFVLSEAVRAALASALARDALVPPGFALCDCLLQDWAGERTYALCRGPVDPGGAT